MVLGANGLVWMDGEEEEDAVSSWTRNNNNNNSSSNNEIETKEEDFTMSAASFSTFKSMLDTDWYMNPATNQDVQIRDLGFCSNQVDNNLLIHHPIDSSASCSPSQPFTLDPSLPHPFLPPKSCFSSLLNVSCNNPFDNAFDFASETAFLAQFQPNQTHNLIGFPHTQIGTPEFSSSSEFQGTRLFTATENASALIGGFSAGGGFEGFDGSGNALFMNRAKVLKPLDVFPSVGSQPTLFQKRAAMRQGSYGADKLGNLDVSGLIFGGEASNGKRKRHEEGDIQEASIDVSSLNYDSDERNDDCKVEESVKNGVCNSNAASTVTGGGDQKGKKKGMPAKNLMAERRRRKKLNDRLYMLRSVVPKISKMDRASILGDAIDYLKELLQRINDLHTELESTPPGSLMPQSTSFHPLTPTPPTLPCRVKEELCPSSLPSPKNQPAKVEVRVREGRAVNIHMFCARRPGLLLSTMRALDNLGLDIQQAVISCFNGFALDVFRAEQCREGQDVLLAEQIKAVLLDSAGFHGIMMAASLQFSGFKTPPKLTSLHFHSQSALPSHLNFAAFRSSHSSNLFTILRHCCKTSLFRVSCQGGNVDVIERNETENPNFIEAENQLTCVMKFGGSSVASAERMREVADLILSFPNERPVIVLSAMGKTTNKLLLAGEKAVSCGVTNVDTIEELSFIKGLHHRTTDELGVDSSVVDGHLEELEQLLKGIAMMKELTLRTKDYLVSFGECMSTRIFAAYLNKIGVKARQYDAFEIGFITTDDFTNADILEATYPAVAKRLNDDWIGDPAIPIVTGFLGKGWRSCAITTLGRGGSDLTATTIGKALGLREIQVWKDVDGVLTCDPNIYPCAEPVPYLTFEEASELAYFGAQVLHPQSMRPAREGDIPVRVKNSYNPNAPGTLITRNRDMSKAVLTSIVLKRNVTMLDIVSTRMLGQFGFLAKVFSIFEDLGISVDVVATSEVSISLTLDPSKLWSRELIQQELDHVVEELEKIAVVNLLQHRSIISLIGNVQRSSLILEKVLRHFLSYCV
ncbi:hypothetical protein REPUB_Repub09cG0002900 [Reevesia pubescens]